MRFQGIVTAFKGGLKLLRTAFEQWNNDNASLLAAGIAYFAVFSIAPLILATIAVASVILDQAAATGTVSSHLTRWVGPRVAEGVEQLLLRARAADPGAATAGSVALLAFAASRVFGQIRNALNVIWGVPRRRRTTIRKILRLLRRRLVSFLMVLGGGLMLLGFFLLDAAIGLARRLLAEFVPLLANVWLWKAANLAASILLLTAGFAAIYKFLPDSRIAWKDVWIGAAFTALLLGIGRFAIGLYFAYVDPGSVFGAAGSLIVVLVGVYLSAQVFLLGAEFTMVYAYTRGSRVGRRPHRDDETRVVNVDAAK
jgi:membrane protein